MRPRADFVCLSKHCEIDGASTEYELPIDASHCPRGHKRLKRLFNTVNVLTRPAAPDTDSRLTSDSHFVRSSALLQSGFDHAAKFAPPSDMKSYSPAGVPGQLQPLMGDVRSSLGERGMGRPMTDLEVQTDIQKDYKDRRLPPGLRQRTPPLKAMRAMNREPIPTVAHRDPRGE